MDHIVSYKQGACVGDMLYFKSTAEKTSDLRRWRSIRTTQKIDVILFFEDGSVFDSFLPGRRYFRHHHLLKLKKYKNITLETVLAHYKCKFALWEKIAKKNGERSLFDLR